MNADNWMSCSFPGLLVVTVIVVNLHISWRFERNRRWLNLPTLGLTTKWFLYCEGEEEMRKRMQLSLVGILCKSTRKVNVFLIHHEDGDFELLMNLLDTQWVRLVIQSKLFNSKR